MSVIEIIPASVRAVTLGQFLAAVVAGAPLAAGGHWAATAYIRHTIAGEGLARQELLDEQRAVLEKLQQTLQDYSLQQGVLQSDVGTVKQLQKENRDDIKDILRGINRLQN